MRFGKSTAEYESEPSGGDGAFIKYLRKGDNEIQILDEYDDWVWYWEHYNPGGYPFPCLEEDREHCPGCTSHIEKMQTRSRRAAFNAYDGKYTNVWKVPKTVAEKLKNRYDRLGTITDRAYVITQIKNDRGFYDYDIEGQEALDFDKAESEKHKRVPGELLEQAWNDAWGDPKVAANTQQKAAEAAVADEVKTKLETAQSAPVDEDPPWAAEKKDEKDETVFSEAELRAMSPSKLIKLCKIEGVGEVPPEFRASSDLIVDWMLETTAS